MSKDRKNIPMANMLMGSMRSMGYSFESAIADIIDNSISADCKNVSIFFPTTKYEALAIGILDDGHGLNTCELFEAMRYGSVSEEERKEEDLGRFGLGMKSASMSQCRIMTVVSKKNGVLCAYRWDYNYILDKKDWILQEFEKNEIKNIPYSDRLIGMGHDGTLVVWEDFDILEKSSESQTFDALCELKSKVGDYLSLIFHRFLYAKKLKIKINNQNIKPLDPFLERNPKTTQKKEVSISNRDSNNIERQIKVKAFILPFATDMTEEDRRNAGGIENFRTLQGFYIYRNKRLIIWGTWFGMKLGELTKNARVRVDIPNSLDDIWGIDIMKRTATIPKNILNQLRKTVKDAMNIATKKQTHRGRKDNIDNDISYIWNRMQGRNNNYYYKINKESLLFKYIMDVIPSDYHAHLNMLIDEIENCIPSQQIYIDKCNDVVEVEEAENRLDDMYQQGITLIEAAKSFGRNVTEIIDEIMKSEPFCYKLELRDKFKEYYSKDNVE